MQPDLFSDAEYGEILRTYEPPTQEAPPAESYPYAEPIATDKPGDAMDDIFMADSASHGDKDAGSVIPEGRRERKKPATPVSGPPNLSDWQDFFSRIIIRFLCEWYIDYAFRGVDDSLVSDADLAKITLSKDDRDIIARPFSEYANKNPWARKHGREIIALADSIESIVILGTWVSRVNRVSRKYKPKHQRQQRQSRASVIASRFVQPEEADESYGTNAQVGVRGTLNGHIPNGSRLDNPGGG